MQRKKRKHFSIWKQVIIRDFRLEERRAYVSPRRRFSHSRLRLKEILFINDNKQNSMNLI